MKGSDMLGMFHGGLWGRRTSKVDPSVFGDPVAERTAWTQAIWLGVPFYSHTLYQWRLDILRFRPSKTMLWVAVGHGLLRLFVAIFSLGGRSSSPEEAAEKWLFAGFILLGLSLLGALIYLAYGKPSTFDQTRGHFWKGWGQPRPGTANCVPLNQIYAVQIIRERCYLRAAIFFNSYELNLVRQGRPADQCDRPLELQPDSSRRQGGGRVPRRAGVGCLLRRPGVDGGRIDG